MKEKSHLGSDDFYLCIVGFCSLFVRVISQANPSADAPAMLALKTSLGVPDTFGWSDPDPCKWTNVICSSDKRVTSIQIKDKSLKGTLTPSLQNLTQLQHLEVQGNQISGPFPSLKELSSLQLVWLSNNQFSFFPSDFFTGLSSLQSIMLDANPFSPWEIPESLRNATALQDFSANSANIAGKIPDFFGSDVFPSLSKVHLSFNNLSGGLPKSFSGSQMKSLWVNGQRGIKLSGEIDVIQNMTSLIELWLHSNAFSGPLPDFSGLQSLEQLSVRDNMLSGPVPRSLVDLKSLKVVNLTNNLLQGPVPEFRASVDVDMSKGSNRFCLFSPGDCDSRINILLSIVESMHYPQHFADNWKGNDPCNNNWIHISCTNDGNINSVDFRKLGLAGTISPDFASLKSLQRLLLSDNNLTGTIPGVLTSLSVLTELDVSNNQLYGPVPSFKTTVKVNTQGNMNIGKDGPSPSPSTPKDDGNGGNVGIKSSSVVGLTLGSVIGGIFVVALIGFLIFCTLKRKQKRLSRVQSPNELVIHPGHSASDNEALKITVSGSSINGAIIEAQTTLSSEAGDIQKVEAGSMVISIQVLRNVTDNFNEKNILGKGGFGTVYKGELQDGTQIAVKRMESGVVADKGLDEFMSEIAVLTKVRHRHLVALLGYCLDGNERLLVYEYMPQGTLSQHLFNWVEEGLKPLNWNRRLIIALDVARGVEYLHGLAHQSFIHRDLKPSNILLSDDMRAKVADFGLVRLAPGDKASFATRIAGTFGYLAPEYATTGRVTTKVDVYSFGVILMELITGRKAIDDTLPEDCIHLVTWFRRMHLDQESFHKAIDTTIDLNEEILASVSTVAELAGYCSAREPYRRPAMGHIVNVLCSLVESWKPVDQDSEEVYGIHFDMSLPLALKKWQGYEGRNPMESSSSSLVPSLDSTQTSIPSRPNGFAESFTSADGR